jgi:hypothetical protein
MIGEKAAHKDLLGYHDIRFGNHSDARMLKFVVSDLPALLPEMRNGFNQSCDVLRRPCEGHMTYNTLLSEFHGAVLSADEDGDFPN